MSRILLINRTDIAEFRDISQTVHDKVLNQHIFDAQFQDLQRLMGVQFYNDLLRNFDNTVYQALLNDADYVFETVTYSNVGLKTVLVHYAYARYALLGSNKDTPFGLVVKQTENSQPASEGNKKSLHKMNQIMAFNYWENVRDFLNRNESDYPLWNSGKCITRSGNFRISKIG